MIFILQNSCMLLLVGISGREFRKVEQKLTTSSAGKLPATSSAVSDTKHTGLWPHLSRNRIGYLAGILVTAASTLMCAAALPFFGQSNLIMIYLLGVLIVATRFGRGPSVMTSVLSVACFDFFFVHPYFTFAVTDTQYLLTFAVMLTVAILISTLTTRVRKQAHAMSAAEIEIETERLRNALLSSLSHDLRTPLATITGATTTLLEDSDKLSDENKAELAQVVYEESERLNRLVSNLLDMTRLEIGSIAVNKEWQALDEVIGSSLVRIEKKLDTRKVSVSMEPKLFLVPIDAVLMEQVFVNLLENATKYSPRGSDITIDAKLLEGTTAVIEVADRGAGLQPEELQQLFDKFYRGKSASQFPGTGLGLTICKGIVQAHGGTITAKNRDGGGAIFTITLPVEGAPDISSEESQEGA